MPELQSPDQKLSTILKEVFESADVYNLRGRIRETLREEGTGSEEMLDTIPVKDIVEYVREHNLISGEDYAPSDFFDSDDISNDYLENVSSAVEMLDSLTLDTIMEYIKIEYVKSKKSYLDILDFFSAKEIIDGVSNEVLDELAEQIENMRVNGKAK